MRKMTKVRALLGALAMLMSLAFVTGCGLVADRIQAFKQGDEEPNQKKLEAQKQQARLEELEKQIEDLEKKIAAQEQKDQKGGNIQNLNTPSAQAPRGRRDRLS